MITKEMTLLEIVEQYPATEKVFHQYDELVGACVMCEQLFATLEEMSSFYRLDIEKIVRDLNEVIK